MADEHYDISKFVANLSRRLPLERPGSVSSELARVKAETVRDAGRRFHQQVYVSCLERLLRHLNGQDVGRELMPSERAAFDLLEQTAPHAPVAPVLAPALKPPPAPVIGKERRQSRRIQMRTRALVRAASAKEGEVVEPVNISRGGICYESVLPYQLDDTVFVTLHYQPGTSEMETRGLIVRVSPLLGSPPPRASFGVKFLGIGQ